MRKRVIVDVSTSGFRWVLFLRPKGSDRDSDSDSFRYKESSDAYEAPDPVIMYGPPIKEFKKCVN